MGVKGLKQLLARLWAFVNTYILRQTENYLSCTNRFCADQSLGSYNFFMFVPGRS